MEKSDRMIMNREAAYVFAVHPVIWILNQEVMASLIFQDLVQSSQDSTFSRREHISRISDEEDTVEDTTEFLILFLLNRDLTFCTEYT